jgi:hypothetical protein
MPNMTRERVIGDWPAVSAAEPCVMKGGKLKT